MNCKKGFKRLLIVIIFVVCVAVLLTQVAVAADEWDAFVGFIIFLLLLWLPGLAGYVIICVLRLISYLLSQALNRGKSSGKKIKLTLKVELRELAWISAVISSVMIFLLLLSDSTKGSDLTFLEFAFYFAFSAVVFGLVWATYAAILFVVRGFLGSCLKTMQKQVTDGENHQSC